MRKLLVLLIGAALLVSMAGLAAAETKTFTDTTGIVDTGWSGELKLAKFDPAWGTLNNIMLTISGKLIGGVELENRDRRPATINTTIQGVTVITTPYGIFPAVMNPYSRAFQAAAYDGVLDFGGTSGHRYDDHVVTNSSTMSVMFDQANWTGPGFMSLPVEAFGQANGSGAANLVLAFSLYGQGDASVTYDYTPVPEPSGLLALLPGVAGIVGMLRFRRK